MCSLNLHATSQIMQVNIPCPDKSSQATNYIIIHPHSLRAFDLTIVTPLHDVSP
jgi:hypothetical protein